MKVSVVLGVLLATVMTFSLQAIENKAVLYDAASINNPAVQCSTCTWIEHSDFKPVQTIVEHKGEKWLQFKFEGTQGSGRAVIHFKDTIAELIPEGMTAYGLEVTIDYPEKDFRKLQISPYFKDGKRFTQHLPLEDGVKTYSFESGFSRTEIPKDWSALTSIALFMSAGFPEFHVKKIAVKLYPKQVTEKRLTIQRIRKISEVLPGKDRVTLDFGGDEPFQAQVGYDQNHLYVTSRAKFPSKPRANFKADDKVGSVWGDELTEYFFSGWNDNQKYIQFVFNLNGVSWDSITDYDKTAAMVIRNITDWNLQHTKKIKWEDGFWTTEAAFPFEALRFDSPAQRFMGFQIVQQYGKEHGEKYQTAVWSPSQSFPDPRNFGILVFNQNPFGTGTLFPEVASAQLDRANDKVDFSMNVNVEDVKPGTYTLRKYIAAADHSFIELPSETVEVVSSREVLKVSYKACKNLNGIYSLYAALENAHGDMRMTAINFDNSKPLVSLFGESVFCPTPKKITWHEGVFEAGKHHTLSIPENASQRTAKTAAILAEKILGYAGIYNVVEGEDSGIVLRVASTVMSNGEMLELSPEGYYLQVMPEKVVITGADEAGLYYGCRIFLQMLRQPMKRQAAAPIRCAEILDWPDLEKRFTNMLHPWQFYGRGFNEKRSMDYLINWVDRYVAGTGQNMFILNVGPIVEYKRRPEFNSVNCLYTLDDLEKLAQFCIRLTILKNWLNFAEIISLNLFHVGRRAVMLTGFC